MTSSSLLVEDSGSVRILTLNRPPCRNALDTATCRSLIAAIDGADADESVRAIVLAGAAGNFCAGADLKEFPDPLGAFEDAFRARTDLLAGVQIRLTRCRKPVIAAVEGAAVGVGASLALCCDMIVASDSLRFGYPEIRHGILPAMVLATLHRAVTRQQAFGLIATADLIDAETAERYGLVTQRVAENPSDAALALAKTLSMVDSDLMRRTKALFAETATMSFTDALAAGASATLASRGLKGSDH